MASNSNDYDLAGDIAQTKDGLRKPRQTSFDATNSAQYLQRPAQPAPAAPATQAGPVGRATQQLASQPGPSLASGINMQPIYAGVGANGEKSFSSTPPSLNSVRTDYPAQGSQPQQRTTSPAVDQGRPPAQAVSQIPARPEDSYPTGIGDGKKAIYAGVGANGEASFSSAPSSINSLTSTYASPDIPQQQRFTSLSPTLGQPAAAAPAQPARLEQGIAMQGQPGRPMTSLAEILPGGANASPQLQQQTNLADAMRRPASGPEFAALGSAANLGDGIGTFSQAQPGDATLARTNFQRAIDLRDSYKDKDRLNDAIARQAQDRNFTVVRDSSRPMSLADIQFQNDRAATTKGLNDAVAGAQGIIEARRGNVAADQQQRQSQRLEDALSAATAPRLTQEQRSERVAAFQLQADPFNEKGMKRQQIQADIDAKAANAQKDRALAAKADRNVKGLPAALQKLEDADIEAVGVTKTMNEALGKIDSQITDGTLQLGAWSNAVSSVQNALGGSDQVSANYASMLATMEKLRNESLRLNKGTQTEGDAERAWNELFTNIRDRKIVQQRIKEITNYNNQASTVRAALINNRRTNQGMDGLDVNDLLGGVGQSQAGQEGQQRSQASSGSQGASQPQVYQVQNDDEYGRLPSGADYIDGQGNHRRKP